MDTKHTEKPLPEPTWYDYVKLTRIHMFPTGNDLTYLPCVWGVAMAAYSENISFDAVKQYILPFVLGATIVHSAACVLSDICDVDFDRQVERTKLRPLVTGTISIARAWSMIATMLVPCLWLMTKTNRTAAALAAFGLFPLHAFYPLMKRWLAVPQVFLAGLTLNWGFVVGWVAVAESINLKVVAILMVGAICYSVVYDTIYACQDRKDDVKAGVKSAAVFFGSWVRPILMALAVAFISCLAWAGYMNDQGRPFYVVSVGFTCVFYVWLFSTWNDADSVDCAQKFKAHGTLGTIIALGMFLDLFF
ncbi:hypothetical protein HYPSUDRAFT_190415 [Hypholoma sublateritium FD-334 SS-4]|uniref:Uncharacterized protein n=1 Tax=Hypholoma sublateritium (strain FD-334 SS-4) TaxID=945553 RepID=A0A0D2KW67_HYPSF|nr:hypothetical protein HYPSUDRAFT_190415 [Hypholoma sublateritium FD-334 SS-4]